ncbi:hypothetical protein ACYOEI_30255 [Singulisphaera rosea]
MKKTPSPRAANPPANPGDTVAPDVPQSNLVLRKLEEMLKNNEVTPQIEQDTGMSREQMEQFVKRFKKAPQAEPGPGREIKIKPGEERKFDPNRKLPELGPNAPVSSRTIRGEGNAAGDDLRGNIEGTRLQVPPELKAGLEAYKSSLSRSKVLNPSRTGSGPSN